MLKFVVVFSDNHCKIHLVVKSKTLLMFVLRVMDGMLLCS